MKWEDAIALQLCGVIILLAAILWMLADIKELLGG